MNGVDLDITQDDLTPDRFRPLRRISEGAFGDVKLGIDTHTGKKVALKYVRLSSHGIPRAVFREMESLKQCRHERIVELIDVYPHEINLVMVFEFMTSDLQHEISRSPTHMSNSLIKYYSLMIMQGLSHCHSLGVIHRDIKPSNILVSSRGCVKIADFGLARAVDMSTSNSLSHQVATRWYRAVELLFGARHYTFSVDLWSAGAVIAELVMLKPLFPGNNDIDQIYKVFQITGTPVETDWPEVSLLPDFGKVRYPDMLAGDMSMLMPHASQEQLSFIQEFIYLNPSRRITASKACAHPFLMDAPLTHPSLDDELVRETRSAADPSGGREISSLVVAAKKAAGREGMATLLNSVLCSPLSHK